MDFVTLYDGLAAPLTLVRNYLLFTGAMGFIKTVVGAYSLIALVKLVRR